MTDANLVLGRILADRFAGGSMRIKKELAHRALEPLANAMGKSVIETGLGVIRVAEDNMAHAVRAVSSQRGLDPRDFALLSFGGAGGLHACAIAESLEIPRVLVPPYCGVLSALGMVVAPPVVDVSRTVVHLGEALDDARLAAEFGNLSGQTMDVIPYDQTGSVEAWADVRFKGQSHELTVRVERPIGAHIAEQFATAYLTRYGQVPENRPLEIVTLRVRRFGRIPELKLPVLQVSGEAPSILPHPNPLAEGEGEKGAPAARVVDSSGQEVIARVFARASLLSSGQSDGPFLLIDAEATTFVPANWSGSASQDGTVILQRSGTS